MSRRYNCHAESNRVMPTPRIGDRVQYMGRAVRIAAEGSLGSVIGDKTTWWGRLCFVRWDAVDQAVAPLVGRMEDGAMEWATDLAVVEETAR